MPALVHETNVDYLIATWESVVITIIRRETIMSWVLQLQKVFDAFVQQYPAGVFLLTIVEPNAPIPPADVRKAMALFLNRVAPRMILSAVVHEGTGFYAASVRSVVIGLAMLTKLPFRHKVFATVEDAAQWFAANSPIAKEWGGGTITAAVAEVRARVFN